MSAPDESLDSQLRSLMRAVQEGDSASYEGLLRKVVPLVRNAVRGRRSFLATADIEDLVQDVLLSLHSVRATYDPKRPFLPWLMAIVRNRLADGGRRHARLRSHEIAVERLPETFAEPGSNMDAEAFGDPEALRQAMARLPQGQRKALELVKMKEMSLKEASQASGMSVAALKVATHRAVKALRGMLKKEA
jgi:RNA polymerase sigma-70 factor (ECF subfamily)